MKTLIAFATAAVLLAGCSSSVVEPQDDPIVADLTGKPIAYVEKKLGLPNKRSETRSGAMIWIYLDKQKGMAANECTVTLSIRNNKIENVAVDRDAQSLLSMVGSSCKTIRKNLGVAS
ncbi:hypothetical protein [Ketobacter alkanivorans]|uniref:Uncharacterized protein n=1 Tax=Ketobacter alkanivorans TaxID=1917421 RepID=A0A2K9LRF7_9GAMM|nr:hypothetical protein [Ketobacter alkanivorans]AUM13404.1 hypothetical protein Kalk_13670 [Ketobacter alkanivorans]MCP5019913.1 hypothetical protein [Ketobacter sp.]